MTITAGITKSTLRLIQQYRSGLSTRMVSRINKKSGYSNDILSKFRQRQKSPFFFSDRELKFFCDSPSVNREAILKAANEICAHTFDLLGSGKKQVDAQPGKINWHQDFKTGVEWDPKTIYIDIDIIKGNHSDVKLPWELSRFQHLPTLGKAYLLTNERKYALEFVNEIEDWIDANPPLYGVNWAGPMDVAIRTVNWIWGYYYFKDSPDVTDEFLSIFLKSLCIHGTFTMANLERLSRFMSFAGSIMRAHPDLKILKPEWHPPSNNHYLSDIVGLIYMGMFIPEFKEAKKWREFGVKELISEMSGQIYSDGVDYEGSISYHRLVTELFLSATLLCQINQITFPDWYMKRLENMLDFTIQYTKPDGTAPQLGDNDDGRLHILSDYGNWNRLDHRYLLSIGAVMFNRADFKHVAGDFHEEAFWLLGYEGLKRYNELPCEKYSVPTTAFAQGGIYIMRKEDLYMIVDCNSADPKAPSSHKHNSQLSFELYAYDKSFVIDPGAYIYTADEEMRNLFRCTKYHNTVTVDGEEQNEFNPNELFSMNCSAVRLNNWEVTEERDILDIEHYGYKRLKFGVIHKRQFFFNKTGGYWVIKDILDGGGSHQFDLYIHLAPMEVEVAKGFPLVLKTKTKGANLAIIPVETEGVTLELMNGYVSFRYGVKIEAPVAKYSRTGHVPVTFNNIFYPYIDDINIDDVLRQTNNWSHGLE